MRRPLLVLAALLLGLQALVAGGRVFILDYHTFLGTRRSSLDYAPAELARQLDEIAALGYRFVDLGDAIAGRIEGDRNVVLTIDDANHSVYQAFGEVLRPRAIHPELFVYPGPILGKSRFFLSPAQLAELAARGCGIGAHGFYHEYMTIKAWKADPRRVEKEAKGPGPALELMLGKKPRLFAYPFGVGSPQAAALLRDAGYDYAFAAADKLVAVDFADPALDRYAVPRAIVYLWNRNAIMRGLAAQAGVALPRAAARAGTVARYTPATATRPPASCPGPSRSPSRM